VARARAGARAPAAATPNPPPAAKVALKQAVLLAKQKRVPIAPPPPAVMIKGGLRALPAMGGPLPPTSGTSPLSTPLPAGGPGDESVLKNAKLLTTDDALLAFFRK